MTTPEFECCYRCRACSETFCTQVHDSPGEADGLCVACWETEDDRTHDDLLNAHDSAGWVAEWASIADNELGAWAGKGWSK